VKNDFLHNLVKMSKKAYAYRLAYPDNLEMKEGFFMPTLEIEGRTFEVDEDGFLQDPELWNEEVAALFAKTEGIQQMTDDHWKIVHYLRNYYMEFNIAPMIRKVCKDTGFKLKRIYELFPSGPAKGACKVAGLPKPTGCV
jgi:dissimilatory sulfite reductase related protein